MKNAFKRLCGEVDDAPPGMPVSNKAPATFRALTKKAVTASEQEVEANPRARSAKLRGVEKL